LSNTYLPLYSIIKGFELYVAGTRLAMLQP